MPFKTLREFIQFETSGGVLLFFAAIVALALDNSPLHVYYETFFQLQFSVHLGILSLSKPLLLWINDGLMTIFFLLVGLEIKREIFEGELNTFNKAILPCIAAVGGMVVPALIYICFNHTDPYTQHGWAIPAATDIAFSLGILALLRTRLPVSLKIFLTALAIFDDIGAILVIAIFYTQEISFEMLVISTGFIAVLFLMNRFRVMYVTPYVLVGIALWLCVLKSGVHATLAGIILGCAIPLRDRREKDKSPLRQVEHRLHPWVAFGVLPIFAFANAGVSFAGVTFKELLSPVTLGIALGLFVGKQIGIWLFSWLGVKARLAHMPHGGNWRGIYGISLVAGVGFTMSLFIGSLAFGDSPTNDYPAMVRLGVIIGSFLSGVCGYLVLRFTYPERE